MNHRGTEIQRHAGADDPRGYTRHGSLRPRLLSLVQRTVASLHCGTGRWRFFLGAVIAFCGTSLLHAEERFPPPEFRTNYQIPSDHYPAPPWAGWPVVDTAILLVCLIVATYLVFKKRSRAGVFGLTLFCLAYFGFFRRGCVCPIGSIQNVAAAMFDPTQPLPWMVGAFFLLPLAFSLFFGRVFCSGVCPLGAIQDLVLWRPLHLPKWVDASVGLFAYGYLAISIVYAATGGSFLICQYDPFVPLFRLNGPGHMLLLGGVLLAIGMFVGRPYCRFFCPYGVLLRLFSRLSWKRVTITPKECIDCRLCEDACPLNAIHRPTHHARPLPRTAGRGTLVAMLLLLPVLTTGLAALGYASGPTLARLHRDDRLARELTAKVQSDTTKAFADTGVDPQTLYAHVTDVRHRMSVGGAAAGAFLGLIIGTRLVAYAMRRRQTEYTADRGACLACARCFNTCPVELKRKGLILELPQVPPRPCQ